MRPEHEQDIVMDGRKPRRMNGFRSSIELQHFIPLMNNCCQGTNQCHAHAPTKPPTKLDKASPRELAF